MGIVANGISFIFRRNVALIFDVIVSLRVKEFLLLKSYNCTKRLWILANDLRDDISGDEKIKIAIKIAKYIFLR